MEKKRKYECVFKREKNIFNHIMILLLCILLCFSLQPTISNIILINTQINYTKYLKSIEDKKDKEGFSSLYSINSDLLAWLKIDDVDLSVPILKTSSKKDEDFYLTHGFDKKDNYLGCPYQSYSYDLSNNNTLFIGHSSYTMTSLGNKTNVSLFGKLNDYVSGKNNSFNYKLTLQTENEIFNYEIVGFFYYNIKNTYTNEYQEIYNNIYNAKNFTTQNELDNFVNTINKYSEKGQEISASLDDQFLTLFTCYYDLTYRTIVIAQKVK